MSTQQTVSTKLIEKVKVLGDEKIIGDGVLYSEYKKLADAEEKVIFGGRLGEYKYYDMDQVIAAVLDKCENEFCEMKQ